MAAFSNIDSLDLGSLLQTVYTNGVRNQISEDFRDFEYVSRLRLKAGQGRTLNYQLQTAYGLAATQSRNPGTRYSFPRRQRSTIAEYEARLKEKATTIDIDLSQWERELATQEKYAESFALEVQSKAIGGKRLIAAEFHRDGTGVIGEIESAGAFSASGTVITIKSGAADPGHVGMFMEDDLLICTDNDGSARGPGTTTNFYAWKVTNKDRANNTVTIEPVDANGANDADAADPTFAATNVFYRVGDPALNDVGTSDNSSVTSSLDLSSISDYGSAGFDIAGIDAFAQNDGRTVNGVTLSGANAATVKTLSNNESLDVRFIQQLMSDVKIRVGAGAYKWKMMTLSPEAADTLIDSREADRRFHTAMDNTRGVETFYYQHRTDKLEIYESEFCKPASLYILPEATDGKKVIEYWGTDWENVRGPKDMGQFHLSVNSSGEYENAAVSFMKVKHQCVCLHAAAIGRLNGFSVIS